MSNLGCEISDQNLVEPQENPEKAMSIDQVEINKESDLKPRMENPDQSMMSQELESSIEKININDSGISEKQSLRSSFSDLQYEFLMNTPIQNFPKNSTKSQ